MRKNMCKIWILLFFCIVWHVPTCEGSAWLQDPPSRSAAWYYQIKTPVNYNFRNLDCGGVPVRINSDGTRNCGLCGDPYTDPTPRENEVGGIYANPRVRTRYYESGQVAEISIWNNLPGAPGFYEFRLCDEDSNQTQACLDKHLLTIQDTGTTYMPVPKTQGLVMVHLELPVGVTCNYCLLQWRFRKESLAGCDDQNWCGVGRGAQIEFYNCADVMIGSPGQPKPSFIQDPIYTASDYGSAYDVATTRTDQPDGSNLVGSTTTQATTTITKTTTTTTKGVPIFTIPTGFPTNNPATTGPITTSGTTINPVTTNGPATTPGTTQAATIRPQDSRLVVDANGNTISGQSTFGGGSNPANNRYLLVLLSLLPLFGAVGLQNSRSGGLVQPPPVPPSAPVTWAQAFPIYPIQLDNTFGFGNFRAGNPVVATRTYASKSGEGTYGSKSGYHPSYSIFNARQKINGLVGGSRQPGGLNLVPSNLQNMNTFQNNNINKQWNQANTGFLNNGASFNSGVGQLAKNPVVWKTNGVTVNNGFSSHVFPRSTNFQNGTPYQPSPNQYSKSSGIIANSPSPSNEYGKNHQVGYAPHNNNVPPNPGMHVRANAEWPTNHLQRINGMRNGRIGQGMQDWQNNAENSKKNNWQINGAFDLGNGININGAGPGQRLSVPETVTQRMRIIAPTITPIDNSFNLPGIESAARFQVNPRQILETSQPMKNVIDTISKSNGPVIQNGDRQVKGAFSRTQNRQNILLNNNDPRTVNQGRTFLVNEWYSMLLNRFPGRETRLL